MTSHDRSRRLFVLASAAALAPALPAFAQQAPKNKEKLTMDVARGMVMDLPEVKEWQAARQKISDEKKSPTPTGGVLTGRRKVQGREHWAVTFYEDPQTQPKKWNTFLVRDSDGKMFVDVEGGKPQTLEQWRKAPKPSAGG
jgi:hypothetical protein